MRIETIGWIGTGVMGQAMCRHLMNAGYQLLVYNRSREKAESLLEGGAIWHDSPRSVAASSQVVFTMVGFPADVAAVVMGADGVLAGMAPGGILADMTTSSPALSQEIFAAAAEKGIGALDAPVSGGDVGAREATLSIMVGGEAEPFETLLPVFGLMGKTISHMGPAGAGQHTKMSNQILIAGTMIGVVESLLYAERTGLDPAAVIDVIGKGAAGSWSINNLGRRIAQDDFRPGFYIKHFVKDMGIALEEARRMNLSLPGLALAQQFYIAAQAMGLENLGTQGLYKVIKKMNSAEPEP
jgi:3-hydroxyisobutyrate dehydrogenase